MSQYTAVGRSNYVEITDLEALKKALEIFGAQILIQVKDQTSNVVCFLCNDFDGAGWSSISTYDRETDTETHLDVAKMICPFLKKGQILVLVESGSDKLKYIGGAAGAFNHKGRSVHIDLDDIYALAARTFRVARKNISEAEY